MDGTQRILFFILLALVVTFILHVVTIAWILQRALFREARAEGQEFPVAVKADYEFSSEWSRVMRDFGRASRRLRVATYELVRRADPDLSIDGLSARSRTRLMAEEFERALKSERYSSKSLDMSTKIELRQLLKKLESEVRRAEEEVAKWREQIRGLEGEGKNKLPAGISVKLPIPSTVNEKMLIKKARIAQIKDKLGL